MVVEKKPTKLKITVDNSLPLYNINNEDHASEDDLADQGEVLFIDYLNHQDSALAPIQEHLRDKVEITRPFRKRKRYQNPDYYIRNKPISAVDEKVEEEAKPVEEKQEDTKDLSAAEKLKRKHNRAKTFGQVWGEIIAPESDLIQRYQLKTIEEKHSKVRTTSIHVTGVNNLSTEQVFQYFNQHPPESLEWVDDDSCNIVYETEKECSSCFLRYLSTTMPEYHRVSQKKVKEEKCEKPTPEPTEKEESSKENWDNESVEEGELDDEAIQNSENCVKLGDELIYISGKKEENLDDLKTKLTSIWRFGPVKIVDDQILLLKCRYAVEDDRKEQNSMTKSKYYRDHGNPYFGNMKGIISNSFKQRYLKSKTDFGFNVEKESKKKSAFGENSVFSRLGRKRDWDDSGPEEMSASDVKDLIRKTAHVPILESRIVERRISTSSSSDGEENKAQSDSGDEFMMTLKANKRMKLYSDDLIEKSRHKRKKPINPKLEPLNPRLDIKRAPVLKVEMVNEYAEKNLQRIKAKERIGHKSQNDGLKVTPDGFIDTRDLFKDEIEEAKEEEDSGSGSTSSSGGSSSENEADSKDKKKSRSKKKTEDSKSVNTVRVTFTNDRNQNDDETQADKTKSPSTDKSVSSKEGTAELNKTEVEPKNAARVPNPKKDAPDANDLAAAKPNRVNETHAAKPVEVKSDSRIKRSRSPRNNRKYRDAGRKNRHMEPSRKPQRSPDRTGRSRPKASDRKDERRRRSGSGGRKEGVSNDGASRARDERSKNHEKPLAKSSRENKNRIDLTSNTNKAVNVKENERNLARKRRQEEIEKQRKKRRSIERSDRKVESSSRSKRPQKKRRKSASSSSSSSGTSSSSDSSGSDSDGSSSSSGSSTSSGSSSSSSSSSESE